MKQKKWNAERQIDKQVVRGATIGGDFHKPIYRWGVWRGIQAWHAPQGRVGLRFRVRVMSKKVSGCGWG